jgi:hypothetical protein
MSHAAQLGSDEMTIQDALLKCVDANLTLTTIIIVNNGEEKRRQTNFDFVPQDLDTPVYVVEPSDDAGRKWTSYFAKGKYHQDSVSFVHHCRVRSVCADMLVVLAVWQVAFVALALNVSTWCCLHVGLWIAAMNAQDNSQARSPTCT